jgi:DNA replication initiation complex subunit (GINS family)
MNESDLYIQCKDFIANLEDIVERTRAALHKNDKRVAELERERMEKLKTEYRPFVEALAEDVVKRYVEQQDHAPGKSAGEGGREKET